MKLYCTISLALMTFALTKTEQHTDSPQTVEQPLQVHVGATDYARVGIKVIVIGSDEEFTSFLSVFKNDLAFTGQCDISVSALDQAPNRTLFAQLAKDGYPLTLILEKKSGDMINWRLYDTALGQMVQGQTHPRNNNTMRAWAHELADELWPTITGQKGFFTTKIAYSKAVRLPHKKANCRYICVADYDGSNEQALVKTPTINIGSRWNKDVKNPLLFYSEYTNKNVRLVTVDMKGRRRIASNFDGINMLPTFSGDGKRVVYCASRADGNCHLYQYEQKALKLLLGGNGNYVSPSIAADGSHMYFCADHETGRPAIYRYDFDTQKMTRITDHGSAMAPSYSSATHKVAYTKFVNGVVQLFSYDETTGKHTQLTHDSANKDEVSWSPCGNHLLFCVQQEGKGRLAHLNLMTKELKYLTPKGDDCTYPTWSGQYDQIPNVVKA